MLLLADRGFYSVDLWRTAAATGADLLWRVRKDLVLPVVEQLSDGSYLTEIFDRSDIHHTRRGVPARAVEYTIAGHEGVYRLITTILDPNKAPAAELAALYAQRWEFESTLDEVKTHLGGSHLVLRSQHPDGAEQELYGFLLVHHAIRHLMHQAARETRSRSRPDLLHPLTTRRTPPGHRPGGVFPPADSPARSKPPTLNSSNASCHRDDPGPTPASSNAKSPAGPSNAPPTALRTTHAFRLSPSSMPPNPNESSGHQRPKLPVLALGRWYPHQGTAR
jgi:hypothetical protein